MANVIWDGSEDTTYTTAGNWDTGSAPVSTNDVFIPPATAGGAINNIAGISQTSVLLNSFTIQKGCNLTIGTTGASPTYLQIDADTFTLAPSGLTYIQLNEVQNTVNVTAAAASPGAGQYGLNITEVNTGTDQNIDIALVSGESVGIAALSGGAAIFPIVQVIGGGSVTLGSGLTMATSLTINGGIVTSNVTTTGTITIYDGVFTSETAATTKLWCYGGTVNHNLGTITAVEVFAGATLDFHNDLRAVTVTNLTLHRGATLDVRGGHVTFSNDIKLGASLSNVTILSDPGESLSFTSI